MKVVVTGDYLNGEESKARTIDVEGSELQSVIQQLLFTRDMLSVTITKAPLLKHLKRLNDLPKD